MKRLLTLLLAAAMVLALAACGGSPEGAPGTPSTPEETPAPTQEPSVEPTPSYAQIVPDALQGVWADTAMEGVLTLYAFQDNKVETTIVNIGTAAADALSGTYTVGDGKVSYKFDGATGYSTFTYENDVLALFNANGAQIRKLSAGEVMEYLTQEESSGNNKGVICLADLIVNYYPDSAESGPAGEKKEAAAAAIKAEGEAALQNLRTDYDKVQKLTWYQHKDQPQYADICCYIYPYIGRMDTGKTWLRVVLNYTDAQTDAGWIFFNKVTFSVDGENTTKAFSRSEITRDNDTEVWEIADFEPNATEVVLLRSIADSDETIIRFEGDEYYEDHVVTDKEKSAIVDVLIAYDYLSGESEAA